MAPCPFIIPLPLQLNLRAIMPLVCVVNHCQFHTGVQLVRQPSPDRGEFYMIEVENLVKKYGEVTAVKGISFTANPGEVTGFLGPNGAGKTTTMRMLTGFMPPTSGQSGRRRLRCIRQQHRSAPARRLSAGKRAALPRYDRARLPDVHRRNSRHQEPPRSAPTKCWSASACSTAPTATSARCPKGCASASGWRSALLHDPPVLILDEPTIGLDPLQVLELRALVAELGRDHTVLFSTHILSEAEQVCDKVVIINQGQIIAQGSPVRTAQRTGTRRSRAGARRCPAAGGAGGHSEHCPACATPRSAVGWHHRHARPTPTIDPRPEIARAVVENGWNLMELRPLAVNLEEIFLELTRHQATTAAIEEAEADSKRKSYHDRYSDGNAAGSRRPAIRSRQARRSLVRGLQARTAAVFPLADCLWHRLCHAVLPRRAVQRLHQRRRNGQVSRRLDLRARPAHLPDLPDRPAADHASAGGRIARRHARSADDPADERIAVHHRQVSGGVGRTTPCCCCSRWSTTSFC